MIIKLFIKSRKLQPNKKFNQGTILNKLTDATAFSSNWGAG